MSITGTKPILSPSLNEYGPATLTDEHANVIPLLGVVQPDSSGHTGTMPTVTKVAPSQVTGRIAAPTVGTNKLPLVALVGIDTSTGAPIPFKAASAATADTATSATSATTATSVSGKFQSAVRVATGSAESIAHGLGTVPSLVHVAIYDNTDAGVLATGFVVTEGTHTTTNVVVTVTANAKYKVIAFK